MVVLVVAGGGGVWGRRANLGRPDVVRVPEAARGQPAASRRCVDVVLMVVARRRGWGWECEGWGVLSLQISE